jgi:tetratricopeptide (TPR) repeat protein
VGGGAGETFEGPDLDVLVNNAAEHIMAATQPYLYAVWLSFAGKNDASAKAFLSIARSNAAASERAWAYAALISERYFVGDFAESEEFAREAIRLDPNLALAWSNIAADRRSRTARSPSSS